MNPLTAQALLYLEKGMSIFPLGEITINSKGEKRIVYPIKWKEYQKRLPTAEEVITWFEKKKYPNIGCVTGNISHLFVLDADTYKPNLAKDILLSFTIPLTPCQKTARGGDQYFFSYTGSASNAVGIFSRDSGLDIRANGGMVVLAPSQVIQANGTVSSYAWSISLEDELFAPLPMSLSSLSFAKIKEKKTLPELLTLKEGEGRDNAIAHVAGLLCYSLSPERWPTDVWPAMKEFNKTYSPPLPLAHLQRIYHSITATEEERRWKENPIPPTEKFFTPSLSLADFLDIQYPEARFAVKPFFTCGTLNMVSAPSNEWKSWFIMETAASIAAGKPLLGRDEFSTTQSRVMIINEEDPPRSVQDRIKILGIVDKSLPIYFHVGKGIRLEKKIIDCIIAEVKEKNISVIFFDSLRAMHDADENDSTEMQRIMNLLKIIMRENITVIFTHHHRKKGPFEKGNVGMEASRGSSAINAAINGHISLSEEVRDMGIYVVVRHLKSKDAAKVQPFEMRVVDETENEIRFEYKGDYKAGEKKTTETKDAIIAIMQKDSAWHSAKDFINREFAGHNIIRESLRQLKDEKLIISMTRKEAEGKEISVESEGRANELIYSWNSKKVDNDEWDLG
mgnify:CR=1 FL=1